jgi:cytochrome c oxidase subunit 4
MSTHADTHDAHGHGDHGHGGHGKDHVPHVLPLSMYFATWGALLFLTVVTVGASYVDFGSANLWIAMLIATIKASVVALLFMHLWFDHKFHALIFVSSLIFLAIFIAFTMFDTEARGRADALEAARVGDLATPHLGTRRDAQLKSLIKEPAADRLALPAGAAPKAAAPGSSQAATAPVAAPSGSAAPADSAAPAGSASAPPDPPPPGASGSAAPSAAPASTAAPADSGKVEAPASPKGAPKSP